MRESDLKKQILQGLQYRGIYCWVNQTVGVWNKKTQGYYKSGKKGVGDILGLLPKTGQFLCIEVKVKPNVQTIEQKYFEEDIKKNNGVYILAYNWETVDEFLLSVK